MTEPNRAQRRAAAKDKIDDEVQETNRIRVTIGGKATDIEVGTREIARLELKGHTSEQMAERGVLGMWLMAFEHMLWLQRKGETDLKVPEDFESFLDDAEVEPLLGEG